MPEAYSWMEGQVSIYTGAGATSAVVAYAENTDVTLDWGWLNEQGLNSAYFDHLTGQRANVSIQALYTFDKTIAKIVASATAVHMKLMHSGVNGSAGYFLYSGHVQQLKYAGSEANPYVYSLAAYFNRWSAF